jgi:arylsulfatase B
MLKYVLLLVLLLTITVSGSAQRNVILIIADDLGADYCSFYENHLDTVNIPNVRALAERGVRFTNAWSNPLCSPTRAGILTGRYSFRTGVGNAVGGADSPVLDKNELTIPILLKAFKKNDIATANIGKWHLQLATPKSNLTLPNTMGYDHYEGNFLGALTSYTDWNKVTNGVAANCTTYATTETVNNAVTWIAANRTKPYFLWLAFNAPHTPFHLPPKELHSYQTLSGTEADIAANPKLYFKAAAEAMDHEIGRLFDSLKAFGDWENTDIIFIGDNGDDANVAQTKGGAKGSIYQDGISVPFIIAGPSIITPNRVSDALVNTQDLFGTILEIFSDTAWLGRIPIPIKVDSKSLVPILKNQATSVRDWAFSEVFKVPTVAGDGKTMRNKDYKLLDFDNGTQKFYHLTTDPNESNDLLKSALTAEQQSNYTYLCNQMSALVGSGRFCDIASGVDEGSQSSDGQDNSTPNPFTSQIRPPRMQENTRSVLTNAAGQVVFDGLHIERHDFSSLTPGMYLLQCTAGTTVDTYKLLKK